MPRVIFILFGFFLATCQAVYSQSQDFALWEGFALKYELIDPLSVSVESSLRLNNNASQLKTAFTNVGFNYKVSSPVRLTAGYRFSLTLKQNRHRFYSGISYRYKVKSIRTSFRARLRYQYTIVGNKRPRDPESYLRFKLQPKYDIKGSPFAIFVGADTWFNLTKPVYDFDRYRLQIGLDYEVSKRNTLGLIYQYQHEFNVTDPLFSHIVAFEVGIDITPKKEKKKKKEE